MACNGRSAAVEADRGSALATPPRRGPAFDKLEPGLGGLFQGLCRDRFECHEICRLRRHKHRVGMSNDHATLMLGRDRDRHIKYLAPPVGIAGSSP